MPMGLDPTSVLVGVAIALVLLLVLDLLFAGGGMSAGMMGGVSGAMATPWGWVLLVLLAVLVGTRLGR